MKVLAREGNTLSPVIRNAWDGKTLQTMAKNSPLRATGAHIGIVGHITKQELLRHITATELANGFFNRFMVVAVQRSKDAAVRRPPRRETASPRPRAGPARRPLRRRRAADHLRPEAREWWIAAYDELSAGEAGLAGAATARAEAHTVRLALLYALLDCSDVIELEHLEAALAFWAYRAPRRPLGVRRQHRRPHRRRDLGARAGAPRRHHPHRGPTCSRATRKPARSTAH